MHHFSTKTKRLIFSGLVISDAFNHIDKVNYLS